MTKLIAAALVVGLIATSGMAQSKVAAQIPFSFYVVDYKLPAGSYEIGAMSNGQVIRVASTDSKDTVVALFNPIVTASRMPPATAKLVFTRYGNEYFLSEVWSPDASIGRAVPKTHHELELAKQNEGVRIESVLTAKR